MRTGYFHISAYPCDRCNGPVIAGAFGIRETEISRESELTTAGSVCLTCGNKQAKTSEGSIVRQVAPVKWDPRKAPALVS
jgi:hypothetical protein